MRNHRCLSSLLVATFVCPAASQSASPPDGASALTAAVLAQAWPTVLARGPADASAMSAQDRVLRAQACLWSNRCGEATSLFLSAIDARASAAWLAFAAQLAAQHVGAAMAHCLHADALARCGQPAAALAEFDAALALDATLVPALIGRGVVLARQSCADPGARRDIEAACRLAPDLAEAHASLGTLQVLRRAASGAERSFLRALQLAPDHVLARNGLGCARYGLGHGAWPQAMADFAAAADGLALPLIEANLSALAIVADKALRPGQDTDPSFRFSDFLDWPALLVASGQLDAPIRVFYCEALPTALDADVLAHLNTALDDATFAARIAPRLQGQGLPPRLREVLDAADPSPERIRVRNRRLLEHCHPGSILPHDARDPGTTFNVATSALGGGRMGWLLPKLDVGFSRQAHTQTYFRDQSRGITAMQNKQVGGVTTDQSAGFVDRGPWPVVTWFGLLHSMPDAAALRPGSSR